MYMVLCFITDKQKEKVLLIKKKRPCWQKGKMNGLGGKVEKGETSLDAVAREIKEETGGILDAKQQDFFLFGTITVLSTVPGEKNDSCHLYGFSLEEIPLELHLMNTEEGILAIYDIAELRYINCLPNVEMLVHASICPTILFLRLTEEKPE